MLSPIRGGGIINKCDKPHWVSWFRVASELKHSTIYPPVCIIALCGKVWSVATGSRQVDSDVIQLERWRQRLQRRCCDDVIPWRHIRSPRSADMRRPAAGGVTAAVVRRPAAAVVADQRQQRHRPRRNVRPLLRAAGGPVGGGHDDRLPPWWTSRGAAAAGTTLGWPAAMGPSWRRPGDDGTSLSSQTEQQLSAGRRAADPGLQRPASQHAACVAHFWLDVTATAFWLRKYQPYILGLLTIPQRGPITIAIRVRFEYDTTSYNILRGAYEELCAFEQ